MEEQEALPLPLHLQLLLLGLKAGPQPFILHHVNRDDLLPRLPCVRRHPDKLTLSETELQESLNPSSRTLFGSTLMTSTLKSTISAFNIT